MGIAQRQLAGTDEGAAQVVAQSGGVSKSVTFVADAGNVYASADLVSDLVEVPNFFEQAGGCRMLKGVTLLDKSDNAAAVLNLVFSQTSTSLGTINSAPNISDANLLADKLKFYPIAAADFLDVGGAKVATVVRDLPLQAAAGATSIWVGVINGAGTPTFAAAGDLVAHIDAA